MTPPLMFLFCKIKTDARNNHVHFVFMYLRSSSRELRSTPSSDNRLRNKMRASRRSHRLQYFTQRVLYNYLWIKVKVNFLMYKIEYQTFLLFLSLNMI
ncbi:hypothetical protein E0Y62_09295 [Cytobacillus praedii]|uniref:Uncharacterized protein n=1 Tax=Cytobacillus praedii TaxID=1742358 RepID=A0A4R1AXJ8_9BACI|nr:hypothetical protein E0Y62_09295 [Cytobacillus praedii]